MSPYAQTHRSTAGVPLLPTRVHQNHMEAKGAHCPSDCSDCEIEHRRLFAYALAAGEFDWDGVTPYPRIQTVTKNNETQAPVSHEVNGELVKAILAHRVVVFLYDGLIRVVEPHAYGLTKDGNPLLSGFQRAGWSMSSGDAGWRTFRLDRVTQLVALSFPFTPREGYNSKAEYATLFARTPTQPTAWKEEA